MSCYTRPSDSMPSDGETSLLQQILEEMKAIHERLDRQNEQYFIIIKQMMADSRIEHEKLIQLFGQITSK